MMLTMLAEAYAIFLAHLREEERAEVAAHLQGFESPPLEISTLGFHAERDLLLSKTR